MFNTWIVPLLGLIFLPQTTIVNVDSTSGAGIATIDFLPPRGGGVSLDSLALVTGHFHSPHSGEKIGWVSQVGCQRTLPQVPNLQESLRTRLPQYPQLAV